jgi:ABC-2 type transport system permease protein
MSGRRFALFAALALLVIFISSNLLANSLLKSWRLDLTENHLYSLSPGTQHILDGLSEPIELTLYYSRDAASPAPQLQAYGARVREMLQTFSARSHGRVRFVEVNVKPFSEEEDDAVEAGLEPVQLFQGADPLYFGLTGANAIDDRRTIPFFGPDREAFLEYEITRLISELENPDPTRVALITALPIDPAQAADPQFGASSQPAFAIEMGRLMQVEKLNPDFTEIPADVDVLVMIQPPPLSPVQAFAVDQFILRKGRAFIAIDPASMMAERAAGGGGFDPFNPVAPAPTASSLEPMLSRWGVAMTREVVADLEGALPVSAQDQSGQPTQAPQPLFFRVPAAQLDREDLMTAGLMRDITFGLPGGLSFSERDELTATPLARTSARTTRMPAAQAMMMRSAPFEILSTWPPAGGRVETIALHLSGRLQTAFPEGAPQGPLPAAEGAPPAPAPLTESATPAEIVIVADTDFLADEFYMGQGGVAAADNAAFALNAIDILSGSDALVSLRSRAPATRRMELVDRLEAEAQRRIEQRQEDLQTELQQTEASLAELQAQGRGSGFFAGNLGAELTPEERTALESFRARAIEVRTELRRVERDLRSDIDRLEAVVVFINVWFAPILVAAAGLFLFWRRQRRARARAKK